MIARLIFRTHSLRLQYPFESIKEDGMLIKFLTALHREEGHSITLPGTLAGMVGAVLLAVGAVNNQDVLTIIGGVVLAGGLLASHVLQHIVVDYEIYGRLDEIEKK